MLQFHSYTEFHREGLRDAIEIYWDGRFLFEYNRKWHLLVFFAAVMGVILLFGDH